MIYGDLLMIFPFLTANMLKNLKFYVQDFPISDNKILCFYKSNTVKYATTGKESDYETYNCAANSIGSFVTVHKLDINQFLTFCDFQVFGEFIRERGG